ncbi:MAG TPA: fibronectin type III domain-containing protein, partial [Candidatus Paceibacterota bacterium]|nr:fibronectin type III domain-containing protein [Candidatus Paceibacterota bacterium]
KDNVNNVSTTYSKKVRQDVLAPTNGTLTATPGNQQISLSWSGFSDSGSGLATTNTYKLVYQTGSSPSSCSVGTQIYLGTNTSYTHTGLTNGTTYYYRVCAYDAVGNISTGATTYATPSSVVVYCNQSNSSCSTICSNNGKTCISIGTDTQGTNGNYYKGVRSVSGGTIGYTCSQYTGGSCSTSFTYYTQAKCLSCNYCRCQ